MRKTIALILAIVMVLGILPGAAYAESPTSQQSENPFTDVDDSQYFYDPVMWAVENGITNGVTASTFEPFTTCNRAQIVTFLWRAAGSPVPESSENPFVDVPAGTWYTDAVLWAAENGITLGTSADTFSPEAPCTRAHAVTFLWRTYGSQEPSSEGSGFKDIHSKAYYYDAVLWAEENGITTGVTEDTFEPDTTCARCQIVTFLYRAANLGGSHTVTFISNGVEVESQVVVHGGTATEPALDTIEGYIFTGWYEDPNEENFDLYFDFATAIQADLTLYAIWVSSVDTDGEGLLDDLEDIYGTDKTKTDTDEDGLNDYFEIMFFSTDPLDADTDDNGINDGDEDFDGDGLSNLEELSLNTEPLQADTDYDGLSDGDEVNNYHTDPLLADTDGDGASDGKEVELGTDPLTAQDSFSVSVESDNDDTVAASVQVELSGEQVETLTVEAVENDTLFPDEMPGYLGHAYDFDVDGTFATATLSFEFDESNLNDPDFDPVIYYYNEETGLLEELSTTVNGNVASTTVSHFSTYILINRTVYQDAFEWQDIWDSEQQYTDVELVLVIDDSGSMDSNDNTNQRLVVAQNLIDNLPKDSKIGIVSFDSYTDILTPSLITDKETAKSFLTTSYFYSSGGTKMYKAIEASFPLFESTESTTLKMMVVLSDGETDDTSRHSSVIATANANGVRIYTVGLGDSSTYFNNYLKPLANNTGAAFYLAADADELAEIYNDISEKIDITTDSDGDGIPDYYEDNMVLFNGIKIKLDKNERDTDGDGLPDGDEVEIVITHYDDNGNIVTENGTKVVVKGKVNAHPLMVDTDGDGYTDDEDLNATVAYKTPIILIHGYTSNTTCFGVETLIKDGMNDHYDSDKPIGGKYCYTDCRSQRIVDIDEGRLGAYLADMVEYEKNKNLFAFNYPNEDMVRHNATKLKGYIDNLIYTAKAGTALDVVDPEYLFATKADMEAGTAQFILIGHSMGGLVSRYYIENIGTTHVEKLITIDTPHYGSGQANASDLLMALFSPAIYDLDTQSTLYGGKEKTWDTAWRFGNKNKKATQYALDNQSPALKGNQNVDTVYYAIGGYTVGKGWIGGEDSQLADELQNTIFGFEFIRLVSSKDSYKNSINNALNNYSMSRFNEPSRLDLGDSDGDNVVDHMSQFAVRFADNKIDYQELERTYMVVNSSFALGSTAHVLFDRFHNTIHESIVMHQAVEMFISDQ